MLVEMLFLFPSACACATLGSRRTAMELVMADGNRINGERDIIGIKSEVEKFVTKILLFFMILTMTYVFGTSVDP